MLPEKHPTTSCERKIMIKQLISIFWGTFVVGIPTAVLMTLAILAIPSFTLDAAYSVALFIPDKLGLVAEVDPAEVIQINGSQDAIVNLARSGRYRIYSPEPIATNTKIELLSQQDAQRIEVVSLYEQTGVGQFVNVDEPQYVFSVAKAGPYTVMARSAFSDGVPDNLAFSIEPYVGNQHAALAIFGGIAQILLLAFCVSFGYQWINRERIQAEKAAKDSSRNEWEAFFDEEKRRSRLD